MNALPAVDYKLLDNETPVRIPKSKKGNTARRSAKVIKLPVRTVKKSRGLSQKKKDDLVVEYRPKARKLARSILRKWHSRLDLEEVDSIVDLSLCEAVQRFNPDKGASFMTFFFYHLRGNLIRAVSYAANANCVPLPEQEMMEKHAHQSEDFRGGNRSASAIEVAEALCGYEAPSPDEVLFKKELASLSSDACAKLDSLEKEVISRVYMEEQQLMDIAHTLGYSRCHISRVKRKALETLYHELRSNPDSEDWVQGSGILDEEEEEETTTRRPVGSRSAIRRRRPRAGKQSNLTKERLAILGAAPQEAAAG